MAIVELTTEQRKRLVNIIAKYGDVESVRQREYFLEDTDLRAKAPRVSEIRMDGAASEFAREVISKCQAWGTLPVMQEPALVLVLRYLQDEKVGGHEAEVEFLDGLLAPYTAKPQASITVAPSITQALDLRSSFPNDEYLYAPTAEQKRLLDIMLDTTISPPHRAEAGRELAKIGDPRKEVMTVDGMQFCYIPAGRFWMGSDNSDDLAYDDEKLAVWYEIPYNFWIGRFPVTNNQFQMFVEDEGYQNEQWWSIAKASDCWSTAGFMGKFDKVPRLAPMTQNASYGLSNHPVSGVSWYEGVAFTEWLTKRWVSKGYLAPQLRVTLPSEAEWEKAARGGEQVLTQAAVNFAHDRFSIPSVSLFQNSYPTRRYPYGEEVDTQKSNYKNTGIGTTNAVGMFSAGNSPYGCEEMGGNVWEWMRNTWKKYPYKDTTENIKLRNVSRAVRGGSFSDSKQVVRCANRDWYVPTITDDHIGLRVAIVGVSL